MQSEATKIAELTDAQIAIEMAKPSLLNRVRLRLSVKAAALDYLFKHQRFGATEWRRRQFRLAQEIIDMVRSETR